MNAIPLHIRDHFAIAAMQGILAKGTCTDEEEIAVTAYSIADAMIKERSTQKAMPSRYKRRE